MRDCGIYRVHSTSWCVPDRTSNVPLFRLRMGRSDRQRSSPAIFEFPVGRRSRHPNERHGRGRLLRRHVRLVCSACAGFGRSRIPSFAHEALEGARIVGQQSEYAQIVSTLGVTAWKSERSHVASTVAAASIPANSPANESRVAPRSRKRPAVPSALHSLAVLLASHGGAGWRAYDEASGVLWRHAEPDLCPDVDAAHQRFARAGTAVLAGFGTSLLPLRDDLEGTGCRSANEGECSVTLHGDAETVHEAVLVKYHPTDDIGGALRRQLPAQTVLESIAPSGAEGPNGDAEHLYLVRFPGGGVAYVAVENVEGGRSGPGFTAFVVTREHPRPRDAR